MFAAAAVATRNAVAFIALTRPYDLISFWKKMYSK
jgi:hypothetical protein